MFKTILITVFASCCFLSLGVNAASIIGLGDLAGGSVFSEANNISADGSTIVGYSFSTNGKEAFVYQNGTMRGLGDLPGRSFLSEATGVSADGSTIVGYGTATNGQEAFIYQNNTITSLGSLSNESPHPHVRSVAYGVSNDGNTIVGASYSNNGLEAFIYQNGVMTGLGSLPSNFQLVSTAANVSADGGVIVGTSLGRPFIYQNGVMAPIGGLAHPNAAGRASGISADGNTVVGASVSDSSFNREEAFIYQNGVMTGLGHLPGGGFYSEAIDISGNARRIVGASFSENGIKATLWEADSNGLFSIETLQNRLLILGIDVTQHGWSELEVARGISSDGNVIIGRGVRNGQTEAFMVNLSTTEVPIPATAWLFGSALIGIAGLKRRLREQREV